MHKNKPFKISLKLIIIIISYGFIFYKIKTTNLDWKLFLSFSPPPLFVAIALMPFNWIFEAVKWKALLKDIEFISLKKSIKGIGLGILMGTATPNRVGEYYGRTVVLEKHNRTKGSLATMVGSLSQVLTTISLGLLAWSFLFNKITFIETKKLQLLFIGGLWAIMIFLFILYYNIGIVKKILLWFNISKTYIDKIGFLSRYKKLELSEVLMFSFLRYAIFATQYIFLLYAFHVDISIFNALLSIFIIYLIVTFIPHFSISEIGVRGSIAILVMQNYTENIYGVAAAAGTLWLINIAFPAFIGSILWIISQGKKKSLH